MRPFLSSNAQDFIEDVHHLMVLATALGFLSSNAQDFIEDGTVTVAGVERIQIPEQ